MPSLLRRPASAEFAHRLRRPPYDRRPTVDAQLRDIIERGWVARSGLVILERSRRSVPPNWLDLVAKTWVRTYGETEIYFGSLEGKGNG